MYCVLFKAAVVTLRTFVEYFIAIHATPVSLQCSSGFSARGGAAPTALPLATPLEYFYGILGLLINILVYRELL